MMALMWERKSVVPKGAKDSVWKVVPGFSLPRVSWNIFQQVKPYSYFGLMVAQLEDRPRRSWREFLKDTATLLLSGKAMLRLVLVIMVVALVMTRSRMGNTAFFASLLVTGAIALVLSRQAPRGTVLLISSLIAIDVALIGTWFGVERTVQRITETTVKNVEERVDPSVYAVKIFEDYPLTGTGGGTFYTSFTRYRGHDIEAFYDHVHNDYVQYLTDTGIIGGSLFGLLVLSSFIVAVLAQARRRDPFTRGIAFGGCDGSNRLSPVRPHHGHAADRHVDL